MSQQQYLEILGAIEQALSHHRAFGDSNYIFGQLKSCLEYHLNELSSSLPTAGQLLDVMANTTADSLYHVVGDTVVRRSIIDAYAELKTGETSGLPLVECKKVFAATIHRLQHGNYSATIDDDSLPRLGPEPYHGWIWSDEHTNDIFGRSFRYLLKQRYGAVPRIPSTDEVVILEKGARLLQDLLPLLTPSALSHAHIIACVPEAGSWKGVASSSQILLGGTIFLGSRAINGGIWGAAEHLFHEALHQKLYDFHDGHLLLGLDSTTEDAPRVRSLWNSQRLNDANLWDIKRVFAAFHVYVHLSLLTLVAEQRSSELEDIYGPFKGMIKSVNALERAHYLGEKLKEQCWDQLGPAGKSLTDWLLSTLEFLNPNPPPKGASIHLYIDLYKNEASKVAASLRKNQVVQSSLPLRLRPLAKEEIESARRVLSVIGAREELERFNNSVVRYTEEELGTKFPELRSDIATTLMNASYDRYRFTQSGGHDELVKQMIESASRRVYPIIAGYPHVVAEAKRRAYELRFTKTCEDQVGRLLSVLACAVPSGGRILEIGTGAGVGTAWITAGLGERIDVEVVSVEIDPRLSSAVKKWPWPSYVQILMTNALDVFGKLGTFNLVFVDAARIKYGHIGSVLRILSTGGLLMIDDLETTVQTSEAEHAEKDALRRLLLHHSELNAVEMEWSSGVILATKCMHSNKSRVERLFNFGPPLT